MIICLVKHQFLLAIDGVSKSLIETAKCGIFVEPENPNMIASKVKELSILPKEILVKMGENGYNYAKKNFDRTKLSKSFATKN